MDLHIQQVAAGHSSSGDAAYRLLDASVLVPSRGLCSDRKPQLINLGAFSTPIRKKRLRLKIPP